MPAERGQPVRPRVEADGQPVARDRQALAQVVGSIGDGGGQHDPCRAGREGEPDAVGGIHAAGQLERDPDPRRDATDRLEVDRGAGSGAVEVDEVDDLGAHRHEPLGDALGPIGRGADPGGARRARRRSASGRDSRSMAGMICIV